MMSDTVEIETEEYNLVSKIIHWVMALIIFGLLFLGFYMGGLENSDYKYWLYDWHKSFGVLILVLLVVRVIWYVVKGRPKHVHTHKKLERILSNVVHGVIYFTLFAVPLSGWAMSSSGGYPVRFFGLELSAILPKDKAMLEFFREWHEIFAMSLFFVVGFHMLGAFKHHFVDRDVTLERMTAKHLGLIGGIVVLLLAIIAYVPSSYFVAQELFASEKVEVSHDDNDHRH